MKITINSDLQKHLSQDEQNSLVQEILELITKKSQKINTCITIQDDEGELS